MLAVICVRFQLRVFSLDLPDENTVINSMQKGEGSSPPPFLLRLEKRF